jgi:predicted kinase
MDVEAPPRRQRVVGLIGCPAAGKTTYARRYDPLQGWVHLTLDDLRQTFWPPDRQVYWQVRRTDCDERARRLLHGVKVAALDAALAAGFSVVMADTHLTRGVFEAELAVVERYGVSVEWKVLDLSWEMLLARNEAHGGIDPSHRQPETILRLAHDAFRSPDAWWRLLPPDRVEFISPAAADPSKARDDHAGMP